VDRTSFLSGRYYIGNDRRVVEGRYGSRSFCRKPDRFLSCVRLSLRESRRRLGFCVVYRSRLFVSLALASSAQKEEADTNVASLLVK
jgi:hypothetical protein